MQHLLSPCGAFSGVHLLVLYHLWGAKALAWWHREPRCRLLNPSAFRTLEVASEPAGLCVHLPWGIGLSPQDLLEKRASLRLRLPVQLPHPCLGVRQRHPFGSLKTHLFAFVFQRSTWLALENVESIEKRKEIILPCRDSHWERFWLILFKCFFLLKNTALYSAFPPPHYVNISPRRYHSA